MLADYCWSTLRDSPTQEYKRKTKKREVYENVDMDSLYRQEHSPSLCQMADRPLFGVSRRRDRILNHVLAAVTTLYVLATVASSLAFPEWPPKGLNIFFAGCIVLTCVSHFLLIHWYNQGDVDPKFRLLIYYNTCLIVLLCTCANLYFHQV